MPQVDNGCFDIGSIVLTVDFNVVIVYGIGGKNTDHSLELDAPRFDERVDHGIGISKQALCFHTVFFVFEYLRIAPTDLPGVEKGCPVDIAAQLRNRHVID